MQRYHDVIRESGVYTTEGTKLGRLYMDMSLYSSQLRDKVATLSVSVSRKEMEAMDGQYDPGLSAVKEELIVLRGKQDEVSNLMTPIQLYMDFNMEAAKQEQIDEIRERFDRVVREPRFVGNHEHDVVAQLARISQAQVA